LSAGLLARNAVLVAFALTAALPSRWRDLMWIDAFTIAGCVGVMCLLYGALDILFANAPRIAALRRPRDTHFFDTRLRAPSPLPPGEAGLTLPLPQRERDQEWR
jgi:hypothetical protein